VTGDGLLVDGQLDLFGDGTAAFSPDRAYRYALTRRWAADGKITVFVMLNPSTANETKNDPTIRRCIRFARRWGSAGLLVVNAFALRSTNPAALLDHPDPVGPDNDRVIAAALAAEPVEHVVAAWGTDRRVAARLGLDARAEQLAALLQPLGLPLMCLGTTQAGNPKHPLYLPGSTQLIPFETRTR
jgi:hypothetical protein